MDLLDTQGSSNSVKSKVNVITLKTVFQMTDAHLPIPEPPPPLGAWWRLYALVLGALVLVILLLHSFTRIFS
ncbi:MAG: hypothetical protein Q8O00_04750 [Holophaga sp.]|nr:hypothetical protein [Holophaga sp.]